MWLGSWHSTSSMESLTWIVHLVSRFVCLMGYSTTESTLPWYSVFRMGGCCLSMKIWRFQIAISISRKKYQWLALYWCGAIICSSLLVEIYGFCVGGEHGPTFASLLNTPYIVVPVMALFRFPTNWLIMQIIAKSTCTCTNSQFFFSDFANVQTLHCLGIRVLHSQSEQNL